MAADLGALFDAVYANPDDDSARLVLADALTERGDPRGEFISLQCAAAPERHGHRVQVLQRKHWRHWLGELPAVQSNDLQFHKGFVSHAVLQPAGLASDSRQWATVESLKVLHHPNPLELWAPHLTRLKSISNLDAVALQMFVKGPMRNRLSALEFLGPWTMPDREQEERSLILVLTRFQKLRELTLFPSPFRFRLSHLDWLWPSAIVKQLTHLRIRGDAAFDVVGAHTALRQCNLNSLMVELLHEGLAVRVTTNTLELAFDSERTSIALASRLRSQLGQWVPQPYAQLKVSLAGVTATADQRSILGLAAERYS